MSHPPVTADCYLQITNVVRNWRSSSGAVKKMTTKLPEVREPDTVLVKVRLRIPWEAFQPLQPEAVIDVPADLVQRPILVEAVEP